MTEINSNNNIILTKQKSSDIHTKLNLTKNNQSSICQNLSPKMILNPRTKISSQTNSHLNINQINSGNLIKYKSGSKNDSENNRINSIPLIKTSQINSEQQEGTFREFNWNNSHDSIKQSNITQKYKIDVNNPDYRQSICNSPDVLFDHLQKNWWDTQSSFSKLNLKQAEVEKASSTSTKYNIFWKKTTVDYVREKWRAITKRVKEKKTQDYERIQKAIENKEDSFVLNTMLSDDFKKFYRNTDALFPQDVFFENLLNNQKFNSIVKLIEDPVYIFDKNYIFTCIENILNADNKKFKTIHHQGKAASNSNNKCVSIDKDRISGRVEHGSLLTSLTNTNNNNVKPVAQASINIASQKENLENIISHLLYDQTSESKVKWIAWCLSSFSMFSTFRLIVKQNKSIFETELAQFNNFEHNDDIIYFSEDNFQFQHSIEKCLKLGFEELAILLCIYNKNQTESGNIPNIAAETENMEFLRYLWERESDDDRYSGYTGLQKKKSQLFKLKLNWFKENEEFKPNFSMNSVIRILIENDKRSGRKNKCSANISRILSWEKIEKDKLFIDALFQYECFEQISILISKWSQDKFSNPDYFKAVIYKKQPELILFYLKRRDCRHVLIDHQLQDFIVQEYMQYGDFLYYGAEMLTYIYQNQWNSEWTKELCKSITKTIKTKDILNCHSPILTCLLLIEFWEAIKAQNIAHVTKCEKLIFDLKEYCKNIQETNPQESYISYWMKQKDTKDRNAFQIASENHIYTLWETPEIGTIVKKMWDGKWSNNGFFAASSWHRYWVDKDSQVTNPYYSFDSLVQKKMFFFQLLVWLDSPSLRFNPTGITSIILVASFNWYLFMLNLYGQFMNPYNAVEKETKLWLMFYLVCVNILVCDFYFQAVFCLKTKRPVKIEAYTWVDFLLFIFAWWITIDTKSLVNTYTPQNIQDTMDSLMGYLEFPFTKILLNESDSFCLSISFLLRVGILVINDLLVWVRVTAVLLTYRQMGPVWRMIFAMAFLLIRYIVIIALFLACCAGLFTSIFNRYSWQFIDFSTSVIYWFGPFLNDFKLRGFDEDYKIIGSVCLMAYVCIAGVLLVNLLIAVLSNVYEQLAKVVDSSHRSVLIQYYRKYKWDEKYGYLIFLATPLNIVNIISMFFNLCVSNQKAYNKFITRLYYWIFYFPFIFIFFLLYSILIAPLCYIKGIVITVNYLNMIKIQIVFKILYFLKWFFGGFFFLWYVLLRDSFFLIYYVFNEVDSKHSDFQRIKNNLSHNDVVIFLKFIHSKTAEQSKKDIHSLFMSYLEHETNAKADASQYGDKKKEYMKMIKKATENQKSSRKNDEKTMMMYSNIEQGEHTSKIYTSQIRKNWMVIEILENFVIEDEDGVAHVDLEKMRKLLPTTMTVQNCHYRRWLHSDINALSHAMVKMKEGKNSFFHYQLMNKIMSFAQRLDKELDLEIAKVKSRKERHEALQRIKNRQNKQRLSNVNVLQKIEEERNPEEEEEYKEIETMKAYQGMIRNMQYKYFYLKNVGHKKEHGDHASTTSDGYHLEIRNTIWKTSNLTTKTDHIANKHLTSKFVKFNQNYTNLKNERPERKLSQSLILGKKII